MDLKYRIVAIFLGIMILLTSLLGIAITAYAAGNAPAVKKSNYVISSMDSARSALEKLAKERQISALVYLKDVYTIRGEADAYSDNMGTVASGQLLYITGVDADAGRNIWYKVQYSGDSGTITGYVEREFLACSDARLLNWEDKYVTTIGREATQSVTDCADIEAFPSSYKDALYALKAKHPEWIFVKQNTGLDFNASVAAEGKGAYSLIWTKSCLSSWIEAKYDNSWSYATDGIIAYYMDPRNHLTETGIFQFEQQTYNPSYHTESSVQKILNGTFMAGNVEGTNRTYAATFMSLASKYNTSPILQAARVRQEQGKDGSVMISGTYPGFEGYYNYYNVGASSANPIVDGLKYARDKVWNTRLKSLEGGVSFLCRSYVKRGQDTLYLQKFDVDASYDGVLTHQYMQNIAAPSSESVSAYNGYQAAGLLNDTPFVFRIPVYNNMPSGRANKPDTKDVLTVNMSKVENLPVEQSAVLIPYINGGQCEAYDYQYSSSNNGVAAVDDNGVITGKKPGSATITCKAGTAGSVTCAVTVIKADIAVSDVTRPDINITYNPEATLADISLPDSFTWADPATVPTVDNQGYTAVYSPDNSRFNALSMTLDVQVARAKTDVTEITVPTDVSIPAGSELSTAALPNYFKWADGTAVVPSKAGSYSFKAVYCLDEANYEPTEDIDIAVQVVCTEHKFSEWSEPNNGYITRTCLICGETESIKTEDTVTDEDCTTLGHDMKDGVCQRCGYEEPTLQEHVHEYSLSSDTATCTEDGLKTYTCSCGDSYSEESKATGHHMVGNKCDKCDYVYTPTAAVTPLPTSIPTPTTAVKVTPTAIPTPTSVPTPTTVVKPTPTSVPTPTTVVRPTPTAIPTPTAVAPQVTKLVVPTVTAVPTTVVKPTPTSVPVPTAASKPTPTTVVKPTPTSVPTPTAGPTTVPDEKDNTEATENTENETATGQPSVDVQTQQATGTDSTQIVPQVTKIAADNVTGSQSPKSPETQPTEQNADTSVGSDNGSGDGQITEIEIPVNTETDDGSEPEDVVIDAGEGVSWTIPGVAEDAASKIDLSVTFDSAAIPDKAINKLKTDDYMTMSIAYDGPFGFDAKLTVSTGTEHTGKFANLYYYDPDRDRLELMDSVKTDASGDATFNMKHASDYVITFTDKQMIAQNGTNTILFVMIGVILAGGLGVLVFVFMRMNRADTDEDDDYYFD